MQLSTLLFVLSAAGSAIAHMEMVDPYPMLSSYNPVVSWENKNYDMMAPLLWPGDNLPYPCKGYLTSTSENERISQKSWSAGSWQSITLGSNGAPHKGGSCQLSLSYDYGRTWSVILSIMGGCPTDVYNMGFQIPNEAPSGQAIFSWSWFNHEGNREMYQNCAVITITGGGSGLNTRDYPAPFVANAGVNDCSTIEGVDVIFPNPGKNVRWGGPYRGQQLYEVRGVRGSNCVDWHANEVPAGANGQTGGGNGNDGNGNGNGNGNGGSRSSSTSASSTQWNDMFSSSSISRTQTGDTSYPTGAPADNKNYAAHPSSSPASPSPASTSPTSTQATSHGHHSTCNRKRAEKRSDYDPLLHPSRHQRLIRRAMRSIEQAEGLVVAVAEDDGNWHVKQ